MTPTSGKQARALQGPFWHTNARERLHALLPELLVSIVAMTCFTSVMTLGDDTSPLSVVITSGIMQLIVQGILYGFTYLVRDDRFSFNGWLFAMGFTIVIEMVAAPLAFANDESGMELVFITSISGMLGMMLFCLTRWRPLFIALIIEILVLGEVIEAGSPALPFHVVGLAALAVLFVMRSSATRITMDYVREAPAATAGKKDDASSPIGIFGQVAGMGVAAAALCLATSLLLTIPMGTVLQPDGNTTAEASHEASQAGSQGADDASITSQDGDTPADVGQSGGEHVGSDATDDGQAASDATSNEPASIDQPIDQRRSGGIAFGLLAILLLLATLVLPIPVRLMMRRRTRRALEQEPLATDRAAKLYLAIIERLEAAGIVRDKTQTPSEFVLERGEELAELTTPSSLGLDKWIMLTDVYERARYAELEPTQEELATCWRLYDALPSCTRASLGWHRYLAGPFWHM